MGRSLNDDLGSVNRKLVSNILLSAVVGAVVMIGLMFLDRYLGPKLLENRKDLVYGSYVSARMVSTEFDITYRLNNLGIRGPHQTLEKTDKERIVFIGDSFTFGWGVEENKTWIGRLRKDHKKKELFNLGRGGDNPMDLVQRARRTLPVLKPDRLIVCLLSWNDMFQMKKVLDHERGIRQISKPTNAGAEIPTISQRILRKLFPNLSFVLSKTADLNKRWKEETIWIQNTLTDKQKVKYSEIDPEVRAAFEKYQLNPWILFEALINGDLYDQACNGELEESVVRISHHMLELEELAQEHNCELEFLLLPYRPSNCPNCIVDLKKLGYGLLGPPSCFIDSIPEKPLTEATSSPFHIFPHWQYPTDSVHSWYFPLDGHFNEAGNRTFASWADSVLFKADVAN